MQINPETDLVVERLLKAPPALVWRCWADPKLLCQWYMPKPWTLVDAEIELRPGGRFYLLAQSPDGQQFPNEGAILLAEPHTRLVFTDLMTRDYAPVEKVSADFGPAFTAVMTFEPEGTGTRYRTIARHMSVADARANAEGGWTEGSAVATDQLDALSQELPQ
ncbi:SRPBCC domain-containing protein [Neotabrizicola shimadae]|uniref:SRPBCC domain-containing protein n=1 Tax=Neotabrizicola shimadae TaxID=2807096 RepID=A0A8G0ZZH3_9RHOB|nr:SRPBCC domain-containing protein [Neotabrizicola shimadae]QYZ71199.1 SRPBCC domain-containing protein [Neotabrizicola shimadae]